LVVRSLHRLNTADFQYLMKLSFMQAHLGFTCTLNSFRLGPVTQLQHREGADIVRD
jgi:hypothetical protein